MSDVATARFYHQIHKCVELESSTTYVLSYFILSNYPESRDLGSRVELGCAG